MSSLAINLKSFVNKIVSNLHYIDGGYLSAAHQNVVASLLLGINTSEQSKLLNVKSAIEVINRLRRLAGRAADFTLANASTYNSYAVSVNTANSIIAKEDLASYKFTYLNKHYASSTGNAYNVSSSYRILQSGTITGTLVGGGSGGQGAWAYNTGKNGKNNTITVGGATLGEDSHLLWVYSGGSMASTAYSASSAPGARSFTTTAGTATTTYLGSGNGTNGASGNTKEISIAASSLDGIQFAFGSGGAGGGGVALCADGATARTATAGSASGTTGGSPGYHNSWTGHASTWSSGGGGGAPGGVTDTSTFSAGDKSVGSVYAAVQPSQLNAGKPATTSLISAIPDVTTLGQGGYGGHAYAFGHQGSYGGQVDGGGAVMATGGTGGMRGGFIVSSGGDLLMVQVADVTTMQPI